MALQIKGLFENPNSNEIFKDPILILVPHFTIWGKISLDIDIYDEQMNKKGCYGISDIDEKNINFNVLEFGKAPYYCIIRGLEDYIENLLPLSTDINKNIFISRYKNNLEE